MINAFGTFNTSSVQISTRGERERARGNKLICGESGGLKKIRIRAAMETEQKTGSEVKSVRWLQHHRSCPEQLCTVVERTNNDHPASLATVAGQSLAVELLPLLALLRLAHHHLRDEVDHRRAWLLWL